MSRHPFRTEGFAAALDAVLKAHGYSQNAAAKRAGIDTSHMCNLVAGRRGPTLDLIDRIAAGIGASDVERDRLYLAIGAIPPGMDILITFAIDEKERSARRGLRPGLR